MELIRTAESGVRNGRPASGGYTYRGTGEDSMPWAILSDAWPDVTDESAGFPSPRTRRTRPPVTRRPRPPVTRCQNCRYSLKSSNHRILCG